MKKRVEFFSTASHIHMVNGEGKISLLHAPLGHVWVSLKHFQTNEPGFDAIASLQLLLFYSIKLSKRFVKFYRSIPRDSSFPNLFMFIVCCNAVDVIRKSFCGANVDVE